MKKLLLHIFTFIIATTLVSIVASCDRTGDNNSGSDTIDTTLLQMQASDSIKTSVGVVFDGAGNSVDIITIDKGDTLHFEYSYLPEEYRYRSEIDDTIEVKYICRIINDIDIDSVTLIKKYSNILQQPHK